MDIVSGFSKISKQEKIEWLSGQLDNDLSFMETYWHSNAKEQKVFDDFSENTVSNYYLPYGIAPNFKINERVYSIPMVIEESSVVAAASKSAKFWLDNGGFKAKVVSTTKAGQVHFKWGGETKKLFNFFNLHKNTLLRSVESLTSKMEARGGGVKSISLLDKTSELENYYQLEAKFETCDAMGANFINSVLEAFAKELEFGISIYDGFNSSEKEVEIIMSILTNYTPECLVKAYVECPVEDLDSIDPNLTGEQFAKKLLNAVQIAKVDVNRAVTHNKGIFNGIDAVVLATGNDFRAIEACGHAYAARDGQYRGLSSCSIVDDIFRFELTIPLALGTVGGLTKLHPLAKATLNILENPDAKELMKIVAVVGLAQNFGALRSLVTTGIQKGHMKMHLLNILNQLDANKNQIEMAKNYFKDKTISFSSVREFLTNNILQ